MCSYFDFCSLWYISVEVCECVWWGALPKVMSCLALGLRRSPASLGAALSIGQRCEGPRPWHRGCQHSLQHANTTHTHTHVPINPGHSTGNAYPPACLRACLLGREAWAGANRDNQCAPWCLSCSFMLSLSMCLLSAGLCVRHARCLIRGKFHVTFRGRSVKGCFGAQSLI